MKETFGTNPATATTPFNENPFNVKSVDGGVYGEYYPSLVAGFKGIYSMTPADPVAFGATGHCDIIDNTYCPFNCFFKDAVEIDIYGYCK